MNNNGHVAPEQQIRVMASLPESDAVEFSLPLHVVKKCGRDGSGDTYTIAVWEGMVLHSLCLSQPLETALSVVENVLRSASKNGEPRQSDTAPLTNQQ